MSNESIKTDEGCPQGYTHKPQPGNEGMMYTAEHSPTGWCYGPKGERVKRGGNNKIGGIKLN